MCVLIQFAKIQLPVVADLQSATTDYKDLQSALN